MNKIQRYVPKWVPRILKIKPEKLDVVDTRQVSPVQLHDLVLFGSSFHKDPEILIDYLVSGISDRSKLVHENLYPSYYDSNRETLNLLDIIINRFKPKILLETGIANGKSTRRILESLESNRLKGSLLYSCDIDKNVVAADLLYAPNFKFVLIKTKKDFEDLVDSLDSIDFFYHDSDHSYDNQYFEYSTVWKKISEGGILMSDDINWSNAFLDFCRNVSRKPYILSDTEKFSGLIQK
jgi:predicted O-methyltransferase YrrM